MREHTDTLKNSQNETGKPLKGFKKWFRNKAIGEYIEKILYGMLGAVLVGLIIEVWSPNVFQPPQMVTVNITGMISQYVKTLAKANLTQEQMMQQVTTFAKDVQLVIKNTAQKKHWMIMPSQAVLSGGHDVTPLIQKEVNQLILNTP